jgi:hypothetical protein
MNLEEESAWRERIIKRLANHDRLSDITQEICEETGLHWSAAEALVREVAVMEEKTVRRKRSPALVGLSLAIFLGGLGLIVLTIFTISNVFIFYRTTQPELLSTINILLLIINDAPFALWIGSLGLAMVIGSWLGLRDVWSDWLH